MTWCNESSDEEEHNNNNNNNDSKAIHQIMTNDIEASGNNDQVVATKPSEIRTITCPSCGHNIQLRQDQGGIHELPGLPAGVKFDPNDVEILEHLEAKVLYDVRKLHPLIDDFIPTLQGENGICYTHPEKLPGVNKDGQVRHFFHRPSKAYTTGTRKRRKVHTEEEGSETRWHKTGKTRAVLCNGTVKGFKKILVLYTNYGRQKKPEKTNWVMHQYHLGTNEEEKDGELVVSKVFFQTQPRQCGLKDPYDQKGMILTNDDNNNNDIIHDNTTTTTIIDKEAAAAFVDYYSNPPYISYDHLGHHNNSDHHQSSPQLIPNLVVQGDHASSFIRLTVDHSNKARLDRKI